MKDEERNEERGIIGRKLCGCIAAVNLGYTNLERREMEAEYLVTEHTYAEAARLFREFDFDSCTHGRSLPQVAERLRQLESALRLCRDVIGPPDDPTWATDDEVKQAYDAAVALVGERAGSTEQGAGSGEGEGA
jgi:hypothetical protein